MCVYVYIFNTLLQAIQGLASINVYFRSLMCFYHHFFAKSEHWWLIGWHHLHIIRPWNDKATKSPHKEVSYRLSRSYNIVKSGVCVSSDAVALNIANYFVYRDICLLVQGFRNCNYLPFLTCSLGVSRVFPPNSSPFVRLLATACMGQLHHIINLSLHVFSCVWNTNLKGHKGLLNINFSKET